MPVSGFGIHTSIWAMNWTPEAAEVAIRSAVHYKLDFVEIAMPDPTTIDAVHTKRLLEQNHLEAVGSLGLPERAWASVRPDAAIEFLSLAIDKTAAFGGKALSGAIFGGLGERTGLPPTQGEYDNLTRAMAAAAKHAKSKGIALGIEPLNRYENHLLNTAQQGIDLIERIGADNIFMHLDTYHMNIEENGAANGILACGNLLKYIHLSESDRGTPGYGNVPWNEIFAALAAIKFKGGLAMESFINMPPEFAYGLAVWRPVADSMEEVMDKGLPFLRNKAEQYGLTG